MSVADSEIEEPSDREWCFEHAHYRPCKGCRNQCDIEREEARKED